MGLQKKKNEVWIVEDFQQDNKLSRLLITLKHVNGHVHSLIWSNLAVQPQYTNSTSPLLKEDSSEDNSSILISF